MNFRSFIRIYLIKNITNQKITRLMKILTKSIVMLIVLVCVPYFASSQTLKERIDEAKTVKIYFKNSPITHSPNKDGNVASAVTGTGCEKFGEPTPLPQEYIDVINELVDIFNKGFETTAFVAGDFSAVPERTSGMLKGEPDWVKLGEDLMFFVNTWGFYSVKMGSEGKINNLAVETYLIVYGIKKGKIKIITQKQLASEWAEPINTTKCDDYAYFTEHFPANMLVNDHKEELLKETDGFIAKDMKKYNKKK